MTVKKARRRESETERDIWRERESNTATGGDGMG
jgi:hypothetical protein